MEIKKQIEYIWKDFVESFEYIPKIIIIEFWVSGVFKLMEYSDFSKYCLLVSFFVMSVIMLNFISKRIALRIVHYADKRYPKNTDKVSKK